MVKFEVELITWHWSRSSRNLNLLQQLQMRNKEDKLDIKKNRLNRLRGCRNWKKSKVIWVPCIEPESSCVALMTGLIVRVKYLQWWNWEECCLEVGHQNWSYQGKENSRQFSNLEWDRKLWRLRRETRKLLLKHESFRDLQSRKESPWLNGRGWTAHRGVYHEQHQRSEVGSCRW